MKNKIWPIVIYILSGAAMCAGMIANNTSTTLVGGIVFLAEVIRDKAITIKVENVTINTREQTDKQVGEDWKG